jgi:hypothetical protein
MVIVTIMLQKATTTTMMDDDDDVGIGISNTKRWINRYHIDLPASTTWRFVQGKRMTVKERERDVHHSLMIFRNIYNIYPRRERGGSRRWDDWSSHHNMSGSWCSLICSFFIVTSVLDGRLELLLVSTSWLGRNQGGRNNCVFSFDRYHRFATS